MMKGFYSKQAVKDGKPIAVYLDTKGNEVEVTAVYESENRMKELYLYNDVVSIGDLLQFVRRKD